MQEEKKTQFRSLSLSFRTVQSSSCISDEDLLHSRFAHGEQFSASKYGTILNTPRVYGLSPAMPKELLYIGICRHLSYLPSFIQAISVTIDRHRQTHRFLLELPILLTSIDAQLSS